MDFMRKIILTSCILSVVITIAECVKPGEKFSRQLKTIFSLIFIIGIVTAGIKTGIDFELPDYDETQYSNNYSDIEKKADDIVKSEIEDNISQNIENLLKKNNISYEKIYTYININEDRSIDINRIDYKGKDFEQAQMEIRKAFTDAEVNKIE